VANQLNLALTLSLNDRLVGPLRRALGLVDRNVKEAERSLEGMGRTGKEAAQALGQVGQQASGIRNATREVRELDRATRDAERSGSRLAGAFGQVRNLVRGVTGVVAGGAAFSHVVAAPLRRAADYDTSLRGLANTAYARQSLDVRRAGLVRMDAAITSAVRAGGGNRDEALEALNQLVAQNVGIDDAVRMLPTLQRAGTASGASPVELANIGLRAQQTFRVPAANLETTLGRAMASGQGGGFELRDMARWLPEQMAAARSAGMGGERDFVRLLAANQASLITAGSPDQAGNNLVNLLAKLSSEEMAGNFRKLGVDLPGELAAARGKGVDPLTALTNIVEKLVAADPRFQAARRGAASADTEERRASFEAQASIFQGAVLGQSNQDRQAAMALVALLNNRDLDRRNQASAMAGGAPTIGDALALFQEGPGYKYNQANFEQLRAQTEAMRSANSAVALLAQAQTDLYQKYPKFAEALEGAKTAVWGLAAAAGAAGAVSMLTGGGKVAGAVGGLLGVGGGAAAGGLLSRAGPYGLAYGAALGVAYGVGSSISDTWAGNKLGEWTARLLALFGNDEAEKALNSTRLYEAAQALTSAANKLSGMPVTPYSPVPPMQLHLDGMEIYSWIDQLFEQQGRRR
jgi:hypothetical protein